MYYGVWAICLTAKILFGYFLLIKPLLLPIDFILSADYNCWTPYTGSARNELCPERNPYCACTEVRVRANPKPKPKPNPNPNLNPKPKPKPNPYPSPSPYRQTAVHPVC